MSGSDWKKLLNSHRLSKDGPVNVYVSGSRRRQPYSDNDYNGLLKEIQLMKESGNSSAVKVDRLVCKANENKERKIMEEHQRAWKKMNIELELKFNDCQKQIDIWRSAIVLQPLLKLNNVISDMYQLCSDYRINTQQFERDLKEEVKILKRGVVRAKGTCYQTGDDINKQILEAKKRHSEIEQSLLKEYIKLNDELQHNQYISVSSNQDRFTGGVPKGVLSRECPDEGLRQKMVDEFEELDKYFIEQLTTLKEKHTTIMKNLIFANWNEEDSLRYNLIILQYSPTMKNRRMLYIGRLMKEMPYKTRNEIVDYESWYNTGHYYKAQKGILIDSWRTAHDSLCLKVDEIFREAMREKRLKEAFKTEYDQQKSLCETLSNKATKWRKHCQELQRRETERANERALEQEAIRRNEEMKLRKKTEIVKNQIIEFNTRKERKIEEEVIKHHKLMEEVRRNTEKEIKEGKERVVYREQLLVSKQEELIAMADIIKERERDKEERLESLRELVRIEAPSDPLRLLKETKSSKARVCSHDDDVLETQHPLFQVYSFTDQKILCDKRFRVSNALREAGLISTQYAQRIMASIPPPQPPRRDQKSSLFKQK